MFSNAHIFLLVVFTIIPVVLAFILPKYNISLNKVLHVSVIISLIGEVIKVVSFTIQTDSGYFLRADSLPFHLCTVQIFFIFWMYRTKNEETKTKVISFFIPTAFWGGLMALIIPVTYLELGAFHIATISFFVYHGLLIFLAIYLYITQFNRLNPKSILYALGIMSLLALGSMYLNGALQNGEGVNYFFTAAPPVEGLPLLNLYNGWIAYILTLFTLGILMIIITYIPVLINSKKKAENKISN